MKVLVALDKNPETYVALRYARHLFHGRDAVIFALHVRADPVDLASGSYAPFVTSAEIQDATEADARKVKELFEETCGSSLSDDPPCRLQIVDGDPAEEILNRAQVDGCDMIVLGANEQSYLRGLVLGAVHAKVLHYAQQPVLIARQFREIKSVLVAYRGSPTDRAALEFTAPLLKNKNALITLLHVQETGLGESDEFGRNSLQESAKILRKYDYEAVTKMAKGDFVEEILKEVAVHRHDLVVLGAYGFSRPKYMKLISDEALNLARLTTRPILVFREKTLS